MTSKNIADAKSYLRANTTLALLSLCKRDKSDFYFYTGSVFGVVNAMDAVGTTKLDKYALFLNIVNELLRLYIKAKKYIKYRILYLIDRYL